MKGLLLAALLILTGCQTVSYHTDADFYACKDEKAAAVAAHGGKVAWYTPPNSTEPGSDSAVLNRCIEGKPMVTETRLGGYGGAALAGAGQHGTAFFYSPGGNSGTLYY